MNCYCYAKPSSPDIQTCAYRNEYNKLVACNDSKCRDGKGCLPGYKPERYYGENFQELTLEITKNIENPGEIKFSFTFLTIILVILVSLSTLSLFVG